MSQDLKEILLRKLNSFLNPDVEKRIILGLFSLGAALIVIPLVVTGLSIGISGAGENSTFIAEYRREFSFLNLLPGVLFLALSLIYYERKRSNDHLALSSKLSIEEKNDWVVLKLILESINTHEIDEAIVRGDSYLFYYTVIHYFTVLKGRLNRHPILFTIVN